MPYLAHFGLEEHPFTLTPDVEYFFPTEEHANIIASVEFALRRDTGIIKVVGEVGTGKTLLCRLLIKKLIDTEAVAYINAPRASANSILLGVCHEFGIEGVDNPDTAYTALNRFLVEEHTKGRMAVVVVDEAQHLGREGLELVRLISNLETEKRKLLQIVLFGQTELDELLSDPSMRQLNQRIAFSLGTKPLDIDESKAYVNHRIRVSRRAGVVYDVFSDKAVELLARSCGGIPRVINIVADKSLLAAFADGAAVVQPAHVTEAVKESGTLVKPVMQNQRKFGGVARRVASYLAAVVALAVLAFAISTLFPSSNIGHRLRSIWQAASGPQTSPPPQAVADTPAVSVAATPTPAPAATPAPAPVPTPTPAAVDQTPTPSSATAAANATAPTAVPEPTAPATVAAPTPTPAALEPQSPAKETTQAISPTPTQADAKPEPPSAPAATSLQPPAATPTQPVVTSAPLSATSPQATTASPAAAVQPVAAVATDTKPTKPKHKPHPKSSAAKKKVRPSTEPSHALTATTTPPGAAPGSPAPNAGTTGVTSVTPSASTGLSDH